jgi:sec-independent protein translocase protein TatB
MNVFGVGPLELIVILAVALIFVGPERLPRLAADLARTIRDIRKYTASLAAEFNDVVKEIEQETQADVAEWKEIGEGLAGATKSVSDELKGAQADAAGALTTPPEATRDPVSSFTPPPPSSNGGAAPRVPAEDPR